MGMVFVESNSSVVEASSSWEGGGGSSSLSEGILAGISGKVGASGKVGLLGNAGISGKVGISGMVIFISLALWQNIFPTFLIPDFSWLFHASSLASRIACPRCRDSTMAVGPCVWPIASISGSNSTDGVRHRLASDGTMAMSVGLYLGLKRRIEGGPICL